MADQGIDPNEAYDETGDEVVAGPTVDQIAQGIAQRATEHFQVEHDPFLRAQREQQAEQEAVRAGKAVDLVQRYPELNNVAVAQQVIADAHRVAAETGQLDRAADPAFWEEVYEARRSGATSANLAMAVGKRGLRNQIINSADAGSGCLPFSGNGVIDHRKGR